MGPFLKMHRSLMDAPFGPCKTLRVVAGTKGEVSTTCRRIAWCVPCNVPRTGPMRVPCVPAGPFVIFALCAMRAPHGTFTNLLQQPGHSTAFRSAPSRSSCCLPQCSWADQIPSLMGLMGQREWNNGEHV